ncbi:MAG: hypothetical protein ABIT38_12730, partial [Gemmatimonadaceae bacterium]
MNTPSSHTTLPAPMPALPARSETPGHTHETLVPRACAALAATLGVLVLVGWISNVASLRSLASEGSGVMNPLTAVSVVALAASLWLQSVASRGRQRHVARGFAALVLAISLLHLAGGALGIITGVDTFLFRDTLPSSDSRAHLIPMAAALNFVLLSLALLNVARRSAARVAMAQVLAIVAAALSQIALLGHAFQKGWFETIGVVNSMALPTALAIASLAVGVLVMRRRAGIIAVVLAEGPGATMARGLLPAGFFVPAILGWIAIWGMRHDAVDSVSFEPELVFTLFGLAMIVIFVGLIAWNATQLHTSHLERARADVALRDSEVRFRLLAENG